MQKTVLTFITAFIVCTPVAFGQQLDLRWEDRIDFGNRADTARSVAMSGNTILAAGLATTAEGLGLVVRAYAAADGAIRWADRTPVSPGMISNVYVTSTESAVYVAGYRQGATMNTDIFVRAYNLITGALLWDRTFDKGFDDFPQGITANIHAVVVAGYGGNVGDNGVDFIVRAYDPVSGEMLWEDQVSKGGPSAIDAAWKVAVDGFNVFVAGTTDTPQNLILRTYDARSGVLRWEFNRAGTWPHAIAIGPNRVYIAGRTQTSAYLAAFETGSGDPLWQNTAIPGKYFGVGLKRNQLVAAGVGNNFGAMVHAWDAEAGIPIWQHQTAPAPGFSEWVSSVTLDANTAYVAGQSGKDFEYSEFVVRAYDLTNGSLILDDRAARSAASSASDIVTDGTTVVAVGTATKPDSPASLDTTWVIRTYGPEDPLISMHTPDTWMTSNGGFRGSRTQPVTTIQPPALEQ